MTAKQQALRDIKASLKEESKSFLAFHKERDGIINSITKEYLRQQEAINNKH